MSVKKGNITQVYHSLIRTQDGHQFNARKKENRKNNDNELPIRGSKSWVTGDPSVVKGLRCLLIS